MNLYHLKQEVCDVCGSRITHESQTNKHTNGQYNESRTFECGKVIKWSPNFNCIIITTECPKHPTVVVINNNRSIAYNKLIRYISRLNVDDDYKEKILLNIRHLKY